MILKGGDGLREKGTGCETDPKLRVKEWGLGYLLFASSFIVYSIINVIQQRNLPNRMT
jgi:hypothetical protein